jgi:formylglycine-generating enzyme required for sulfatase activity
MLIDVRRDRVGAEYVLVPALRHPPIRRRAEHGAGPSGYADLADPRDLPAFWIMRTPVTNAMYAQAIAIGACAPPQVRIALDDPLRTRHPVVYVSRSQARDYARWVGGALPSGAQWLRAASGGDGRRWPWGDDAPDATRANFDMQIGDTTPVASYLFGASRYGVLDMAGNVWEWVEAAYHVVRGGSFSSTADEISCDAHLGLSHTAGRGDHIGFRVVLEAQGARHR